jgi:hypothetical protein
VVRNGPTLSQADYLIFPSKDEPNGGGVGAESGIT